MAVNKKGLGKGLDSLIPNNRNVKPANPDISTEQVKQPELKSGVQMMKINMVEPNRDQPRKNFEEDALLELADSIKQFGVLQPLLVRKNKDYYEIIAGERRWRAAKLAGIKEVPVIIKDYSEQEIVEIALIENIQRENLSAIEEAKSYVEIMKYAGLNQSQLALRVGKSQSSIANKIRLLNLNEEVQNAVSAKEITERHARALLGLDEDKQKKALKKIVNKSLTVAQTEKMLKQAALPKEEKRKVMLKGISKNLKIAINTIHQAVKMVERAGVTAQIQEQETEDDVIITIRLPK